MKISAIILNYRGAALTEACLRSLAGQGLKIVMVIDNSADAIASSKLVDALRRLETEHLDFTIHLLNPIQNIGFSCGVNMGLNDAAVYNSDAFFLINNDAVATPGMVARLAEALEKDGTDLVVPSIISDNGKQKLASWYQRHLGLLTTTALPFSFPYPSGCCMLFRRELLAGEKFLDEDFFMYGEDTMLGWRLMQSGGKMRQLDDVFVRHSGVGSSRRYGLFYEYHTARAHVLLAQKTWRHPIEIPLLLVSKCIGLGLRAMLRSMRCGSPVPILAFLLAWFPLNIRVS